MRRLPILIASLFLLSFHILGCSGPYSSDENWADLDQDGFSSESDCREDDPYSYPGADELCDGLDNNCDGIPDDNPDLDGDGYSSCSTDGTEADCDDEDPDINPEAYDGCDGIDNDCDGDIDEEEDQDLDGVCLQEDDCDDANANIYPGNVESCDGLDNNCNGEIDEAVDADGDGYLPCGDEPDCNDGDANVSPSVVESCDEIDNNCDGEVDEIVEEVCDGLDNDCDGEIDNGLESVDSGVYNYETEPNDEYAEAQGLGGTINGHAYQLEGAINQLGDEDWYKFYSSDDLDDLWRIEVTLENIPYGSNYDVYLWSTVRNEEDTGNELDELLMSSELEANEAEYFSYSGRPGYDNSGSYVIQVVGANDSYGCPNYLLTVYAD